MPAGAVSPVFRASRLISVLSHRSGAWSNGRLAELVEVAQPIARCGESGGIGRRGLVFQRGVRPLIVVVSDPCGEPSSGVVEADKISFENSPRIRPLMGKTAPLPWSRRYTADARNR